MAKIWIPISQVLPRTMGFVGFSHAMRNGKGNPCISHMMKYTTGWESNDKKHSYYGKSIGVNFPGFPHSRGFAAFSMTLEIDEKTHAFPKWLSMPQDGNLMESTLILWKRYDNQFLKLSPFDRFCCLFPCCGKLMRKTMHFPYDEVYHRMGI